MADELPQLIIPDAAYAGPAGIEVPDDFAAALSTEPSAQAMFAILTSQNRYAVLYRDSWRQARRYPGTEDRAVRRDARPRRDRLSPEAHARRLIPVPGLTAVPLPSGHARSDA